jgi:hypothetical protein
MQQDVSEILIFFCVISTVQQFCKYLCFSCDFCPVQDLDFFLFQYVMRGDSILRIVFMRFVPFELIWTSNFQLISLHFTSSIFKCYAY